MTTRVQERLKGESAADKTQIGELKAAHQEARQAVRAPDQTPCACAGKPADASDETQQLNHLASGRIKMLPSGRIQVLPLDRKDHLNARSCVLSARGSNAARRGLEAARGRLAPCVVCSQRGRVALRAVGKT